MKHTTTDPGKTNYYSEHNFQYLVAEKIDGYIPDTCYRQRDPRFSEKNLKHKTKNLYSREDFIRLENENKYLCPAGKKIHYEGKVNQHGYKGKDTEQEKIYAVNAQSNINVYEKDQVEDQYS